MISPKGRSRCLTFWLEVCNMTIGFDIQPAWRIYNPSSQTCSPPVCAQVRHTGISQFPAPVAGCSDCGWGVVPNVPEEPPRNHTTERSFSAVSFLIRISQGPAKTREAKSFTEDTRDRKSPQKQAPAFRLGPAARTDLIDRPSCLPTAKPLVSAVI